MSSPSPPHKDASIACRNKSPSLSDCKPFFGKASEKFKAIKKADLPTIQKDCMWGDNIGVYASSSCERVTFGKVDHSYIYTYSFTLGFGNPFIDQVILDFCIKYKVCLAQVGPFLWRAGACLRYLANKSGLEFTLDHLILLYSPTFFRGEVINLVK
ncbi:hypothetical protein RDI58_018282 [Solanum bulbocastanum]|uniref:Uncharacterized protein n=1 Tax=Solanum bulbocastanum TaxID=147425 RepID=A0AAN8Y9Z3_SOLBU